MKKFFIAIISVILGTTGILSLLQPTNFDIAKNNLSEITYNLFEGKTEQINATLMSGLREKSYSLDGTARELKEFGVIRVVFLTETTGLIGHPRYRITVNDTLYEGLLEKNPFRNTYVADIQKIVPDNSQILLAVEWEHCFQKVELELLSGSWEITWEEALKIVIDNADERYFNSLIIGGNFLAEVQVLIMGDAEGNLEEYYWSINIYGKNGSTLSVMIDPKTGDIISKKIIE